MSTDAEQLAFKAGDIIVWDHAYLAVGVIEFITVYDLRVNWFVLHGELRNKSTYYTYDISNKDFWLFKSKIITEQEKLALILKLS